jgi:hypothetical protein
VDGYSAAKAKVKERFHKTEEVKVYPDTTVWIKDLQRANA